MNKNEVEQITSALKDAGFKPRTSSQKGSATLFFVEGSTSTLTLELGRISVFRRDGEVDVLAGEFGLVNEMNIKAAIRAVKFNPAASSKETIVKTPVQVAEEITALLPVKPKVTLLGGDANRALKIEYETFFAAALGAWQYAAHHALNFAISASHAGWVVDHDNHLFIDGVRSIADLEAMCDPAYSWTGRRSDQI